MGTMESQEKQIKKSVEYLAKDVGFCPLEYSESLKMIHIPGE